jgi:membrane fusion protein (multidrug efflux system)
MVDFTRFKKLATPRVRKTALIICALLILIGSLGYWRYNQQFAYTENAYINANVVQIAARVTGQISHLYVENNQYVKQGMPLLDLDREPFIIAVEKTQAQLAMDEARQKNAELTAARTLTLVQRKVLSAQDGDNAKATLQAAIAATKLSQANLAQARLELRYTQLTAPASGWITNMSARNGNSVVASQPLFALISDAEFWVDANFKETELQSIRPGQEADVVADMYPDRPFSGVVVSISGGSGTAFSLLPPQNATGNWVKVTQRVPVRIRILHPDVNFPLRIGATAAVRIHLHNSSAA